MSQQTFDAQGVLKNFSARVRKELNGYMHVDGAGGVANYIIAGAAASVSMTTASVVVDWLYGTPIVFSGGGQIDQINAYVTTGGAGSNTRVGIYKATSATNLYPYSLIADCGALASATSSTTLSYFGGMPITPANNELYWLVCVSSATAPVLRGLPSGGAYPIFGADAAFAANPQYGIKVAFVYAALPATFPTGGVGITAAPCPALAARVSA